MRLRFGEELSELLVLCLIVEVDGWREDPADAEECIRKIQADYDELRRMFKTLQAKINKKESVR